MSRIPAPRLPVLVAGILLAVSPWASSAAQEAAPDPHAAHRQALSQAVSRREQSVVLPTLQLVRQDGKRMGVADIFADDQPVVLNFIYTTCTTICPLSSQVFQQFQSRLAEHHMSAHLVSVSIDPEQDTPPRLKAYAERFHAGPTWDHFTGTLEASITVQRAFDVYRGDKMNHGAVTLLRAAHGDHWVRLDGFASADDLMSTLHSLVGMR